MVMESFRVIGEILMFLNNNAGGSLVSIVETDPYGVEKADAALCEISLPVRTLLCLDRLREAIRTARAHADTGEIQPSVLSFAGDELGARCALYSGDLLVDGESRAYLPQETVREQFRLGGSALQLGHIKLSDWDKVRCSGCVAEVDEFSVRLKFWEANSGHELFFDMDRADMELVSRLARDAGESLPDTGGAL